MLLDTNITFTYKCLSCGSFDFFNISPFKLPYEKECCFSCHCKKSGIIISRESIKEYKIRIPCINCGNEHVFIITRKQLLKKDLNVFCCPETGMQQLFIGNDDMVRIRIDKLEKELDDLISMFGYDDYFINTQVMLDSLNRIHDIAEQGNLYCECGSNDIELVLLSDKINLKCRKCSEEKNINAASNKDLKDILLRKQIVLFGSESINLLFKND